jgi:lysophospholipase L1-like esterase
MSIQAGRQGNINRTRQVATRQASGAGDGPPETAGRAFPLTVRLGVIQKRSLPGNAIMSPATPSQSSRSRLRNLGKNLLLLVVSLILVLGLGELTLRFYNPFGFRMKGDHIILPRNRKEIIYHQDARKLDPVVVHQKNSLGFRGPEPPADFAHWLTLVAVGGSTTECFELPEEKTWPFLLGQELQQDCHRVWLNNAGFCGYSTFGHLILLRDYLVKLKPKVLLFLVGINDVGVAGAREYDTRLKTWNFRSLERLLASLAEDSELAAASVNLYRYFFPKSVMAVAAREMGEKDLGQYRQGRTPEGEKRAILRQHREKYLGPYQERVVALIRMSRTHGLEPVLLTQPVLYGKGVDDVTGINLETLQVTPEMDGATAWEVLELYNDAVRTTGRQQGVLVIDLARELPKSSRYYYDLMHFTYAGNRRVAALIRQQLLPWLETKYPSYCRAKTSSLPAAPQ